MGFLTPWIEENRKSHTVFPKGMMEGHGARVFAFSGLCAWLSCFMFDAYLTQAGITSATTAAWQGLLIGVAFVGSSFGTNYAFGGKTMGLLLVDGAYHALTFVVYGAVLAALHAY